MPWYLLLTMGTPPKGAKRDVDITPQDGMWAVKRAGEERPSSLHQTQAEAIQAGKALLQFGGGELRIHSRNGRTKRGFIIGSEAMLKMNAVEGIYPNPEGDPPAK